MPSFSSSSVLDPAARAAASLACCVDSDRWSWLAAPEPAAEATGEDTVAVVVLTADAGGAPPGAPEPAAEAAGEDTVAVVVVTADAGGAPPGALAAGVDAGTTAVPAGGSCDGGICTVDDDVSAGVHVVDSPAAGASLVDAGGGDAFDIVSGGDSANPATAISFQACARRNATASGVSRISAEIKRATVVRSDVACASAGSASVLALNKRDSSMPAALSRLSSGCRESRRLIRHRRRRHRVRRPRRPR